MLDDIRWEFGSRRYLSLEQFVTEVSRVNESAWPHDKIVMNNPKVAFEYSALISSLDELLPCENLAHADAVLQANKRLGDHPRFAGFEITDEHSGVPAVTITTAA